MRLLLVVAIFGLSVEVSGQANRRTTEPATQRSVILGASYAGAWEMGHIGGTTVVNLGVDGHETADMASRCDELAELQPRYVLIWGHINDVTRASASELPEKLEATKRNIVEILQCVSAIQATPVLATETTLANYVSWDEMLVYYVYQLIGKETYPGYVNPFVQMVNEWIRALALRESLLLFDVERILDGGNGARAPEFTQADGSHLTVTAYAELTASFESWSHDVGI